MATQSTVNCDGGCGLKVSRTETYTVGNQSYDWCGQGKCVAAIVAAAKQALDVLGAAAAADAATRALSVATLAKEANAFLLAATGLKGGDPALLAEVQKHAQAAQDAAALSADGAFDARDLAGAAHEATRVAAARVAQALGAK